MTSKLTKAQARFVRNNSDAARLVAMVNLAESGCWEWAGAKNAKGYGYMAFRGKTWKAHRVSYTLFCGEIPGGLFACHHCDNPQCVNPAHLFLGHASANAKDMVRKGRLVQNIDSTQAHFKSGRAPRGDEASNHKLTEDMAKSILERAAAGENTSSLAREFGVDRTTIQGLLRGSTWKHLVRPPGLPRRVGAYNRTLGLTALSSIEGDNPQ